MYETKGQIERFIKELIDKKDSFTMDRLKFEIMRELEKSPLKIPQKDIDSIINKELERLMKKKKIKCKGGTWQK